MKTTSNDYWDNLIPYILKYKKPEIGGNSLDINYLWWYFEIDSTSEKAKDCFYWFDKTNYNFIHNKEFSKLNINKSDIGIRYIKCFQTDRNSLYQYYVKKIDDKRVTDYFNKAINLEDAYIRFRKFIDWNNIDISYDRYLENTRLMIKWCIENDIEYTFKKVLPPNDYYIFGNDSYKTRHWQIPDEN